MSNAWAKGSTTRWRKLRLLVLNRDGWVCQLCGHRIDPRVRHPHPRSAHVHHTKGKAYGDDPEHLQAAHRECNLAAGDPTAAPDPAPRPMTKW
jgi:5-methylcytosine-specific restriction endonuclease McrA